MIGPITPFRKPFWRRHPLLVGIPAVLLILAAGVVLADRLASRGVRALALAIQRSGETLDPREIEKRREPVPDDVNMALSLMAMQKELDALANARDETKDVLFLGYSAPLVPGQRCEPERLEASEAFLAKHADLLKRVHAATALPRGRYLINLPTPAISAVFSHFGAHRIACRLLNAQAVVASERGDAEAAGEALHAAMRLDLALRDEPFLISHLVRLACIGLTTASIQGTLGLTVLPDPELAELQAQCRDVERTLSLLPAMRSERALGYDALCWANGYGSPRAIRLNAGMPLPILRFADQEALLRYFTRLCEAAKMETHAGIQAAVDVANEVRKLPSYCVGTRLLVTSFENSFRLHAASIGWVRVVDAALAAERYRLRHGRWPPDLESLTPDLLPAVPTDPFDAKPLRWLRTDDGLRIWSVGQDGQDHGGDLGVLPRRPPKDNVFQLFDPERRVRPATSRPADEDR